MTDKSEGAILLNPQPEVPALKIMGEVRSLHIQSPQDVIVIKVSFPVSPEELERFIQKWKQASQLENPVVCLVDGVDVNVMRPGVKA